jgi:hypothetical protein
MINSELLDLLMNEPEHAPIYVQIKTAGGSITE